MKRATVVLLLTALAVSAHPAGVNHRILLNRLHSEVALFIADGDGKNEKPFVPHEDVEYSPKFSADGQWVVFTSEKAGQADVYRVHADGTSLQQLTNDPALQ